MYDCRISTQFSHLLISPKLSSKSWYLYCNSFVFSFQVPLSFVNQLPAISFSFICLSSRLLFFFFILRTLSFILCIFLRTSVLIRLIRVTDQQNSSTSCDRFSKYSYIFPRVHFPPQCQNIPLLLNLLLHFFFSLSFL